MKTIWTVGHSTRTLSDLMELLKTHGIELVVDVRRFPVSTRYPHFDKDNLSRDLRKRKIGYRWLGEPLGGYRKGGYGKYMGTEEFRRGLASLENLARKKRTAILCAEALYFRCHRRQIADALVERGWQVVHIYDLKRTERHRLKPEQSKIFPDTAGRS